MFSMKLQEAWQPIVMPDTAVYIGLRTCPCSQFTVLGAGN